MSNSVLLDKSKALALAVIRLCNEIKKEKRESVLTNQLLRSGTSVGANIVEAQQAQSRPDFISKLSIALKEATETNYWLRLLNATDYLCESEFTSIIADCRELEKY